MTKEMLLKSLETKQKLSLVVEVPAANNMYFTMTINGFIINIFHRAVQAPFSDISFQLLPVVPYQREDGEDQFPSGNVQLTKNHFTQKKSDKDI